MSASLGKLADAWDTPSRWRTIREYYEKVTPDILAGQRVDPYALGMGDRMTPIERVLWADIRQHGLPFYPQYPVGRRFVDFGDPVKKIAIEADGKAFHDAATDAHRDTELESLGWIVVRFWGADIYRGDMIEHLLSVYGKRPPNYEEEF